MSHKRVLITGASSGLGVALAKKCAALGYHLTLTARRMDRLEQLRDELHQSNKKIEIFLQAADVRDKEAMRSMVAESIKHFSGLDVFIANAGLGMWTKFRDLADPDELDELMKINYMGVVYGLFFSLPALRQSKGSFIAISSIQGVIPVAFHTGYVASKFAVNGFLETIRLEEPGVHFLLALPAWISGTELRSHAISGVGDTAIVVKKTHGKSAVSAEDCAEQIMTALFHRKDEIFIPKHYRCVPLLRSLLKRTFDRVVLNKVKGQLKNKA